MIESIARARAELRSHLVAVGVPADRAEKLCDDPGAISAELGRLVVNSIALGIVKKEAEAEGRPWSAGLAGGKRRRLK